MSKKLPRLISTKQKNKLKSVPETYQYLAMSVTFLNSQSLNSQLTGNSLIYKWDVPTTEPSTLLHPFTAYVYPELSVFIRLTLAVPNLVGLYV